jgi:two-component system NtrC family sensor kinase
MEEHGRQTAATLAQHVAHLEAQQHTLRERLDSVEAGMLQAARLAAVGQLAASIAHEINNPLYAARNGLYLIEDDVPPEVRASPIFQMVGEQFTRIVGIIERMRHFYRPSRGELAPTNVNQLLEETLALAGLDLRDGTVRIIFTPAPDLPPVDGNGDQLRQLFLT